jgi:ABC-type nitrate/sulfonate/bicarbonate transport system substrate-binding protein
LGVLIILSLGGEKGVVRIGYTNNPLFVPLFVAVDKGLFRNHGLKVELKKFGSPSEIGYALLAERIDVGFVEPLKAFRLLNGHKQGRIKIVGTIGFPYGATLVVRKDLDVRLADLEGLKIAASSKDCVLLHQFKHDAKRYGVNIEQINFIYMGFDTMLPALEAKKVDAVLFKGSYGQLAELKGHKTLYQNWEVKSGDECCPQYLAHIEYFILVKGLDAKTLNQLRAVLEATSKLPLEDSRKAIINHTGFPAENQSDFPVAEYANISEELKKELGEWVWKGR